MDEKVDKRNIFRYTFCEEDGEVVTVLNEQYLKQLFNSDRLIFEETEHR